MFTMYVGVCKSACNYHFEHPKLRQISPKIHPYEVNTFCKSGTGWCSVRIEVGEVCMHMETMLLTMSKIIIY